MKVYERRWVQDVPANMDEVWGFFSKPENLNRITPKDMSFEIRTDIEGQPMYAGMIVQYKVRPILNIPLSWVTEITQVKDKAYFIDEQRFGPYALWHHQHHFEQMDGFVRMRDHLHYAIGFGPLGGIANALFVEKRINEIFTYRVKAVEEIFGK